jgi:hypothetical protein
MKDLLVLIPFLRKRLLIETDPIEIARVTEILNKAAINYQIKTVVSRGAIGRAIDVQMFAHYRQAGYDKILQHVYIIHVLKKDFQKANILITQ